MSITIEATYEDGVLKPKQPVLSEMAHHLMIFEAATVFGWSFRQAIVQVPRLGIRVQTIPESLIETAALLSKQTGLLSNDALIVAVMQAHGLTNLASNDSDFDRVPGISRYGPG